MTGDPTNRLKLRAGIWSDQPDVPALTATYFLLGPFVTRNSGLCLGFVFCSHAVHLFFPFGFFRVWGDQFRMHFPSVSRMGDRALANKLCASLLTMTM